MEMILKDRAHLSTQTPALQIYWDSTSLGEFKTCPRKYYFSQLCCWRKKNESPHLTFGIWFHKAGEIYDHAIAQGAGHDDAVVHVMRELMLGTAEWESDHPAKNRESLLRSAVWYLEEYRNSPLETYILPSGKPAVELSFRFETNLTTSRGEPYGLSGHFDKVCRMDNEVYILDKKSSVTALSNYYFNSYSPHNQMSLYSIAGEVVLNERVSGVIIDAVQVGATFSRFARGFALRSKGQLAEWLGSLHHWLSFAEHCAEHNYWPANDTACTMYGGCTFKDICNKDPKVHSDFLKRDFDQIPWNPLTER